MGKLFLAISGSLTGDLKKFSYMESTASNNERLWCVYEFKSSGEYII